MKTKLDVIKVSRVTDNHILCELMTINDDLSDFYREIECRTIDIVVRRFGKVFFNIICDDEALINGTPRKLKYPTSVYYDKDTGGYEELWGTLLLCHDDGEGNLTSASEIDLIELQNAYRCLPGKDKKDLYILTHKVR